MKPDEILDLQYQFTAPLEGTVPHIYRDTAGVNTCGIGFALFTIDALKEYAWTPNLQEAELDYKLVAVAPAGRSMSYYRQITHARLDPNSIVEHFTRKVLTFRKQIEAHWQLSLQPVGIQIVLTDLAFQLGAAGLGKFVKLHTAVLNHDWRAAADECHVGAASIGRNLQRKQKFLDELK